MASPSRKTVSSGKSIIDEPHFVNSDGIYLFCKYWEPEDTPTSLVCVLHGYGAHCKRHGELAEHLNKIGCYVFAHDHIGHGESEGDGWYITDFNILTRDTIQHISIMKEKHPSLPVFIYGHSMGANVALMTAHERPDIINGVISSSCGVAHPEGVTPFKLFLLRNIIRIFPKLRLPGLSAEYLSRDKDEVQACEDDPLQVKHGIIMKTAHSFIEMTDRLRSIIEDIDLPVLLTHGDEDKITSIEGSKLVYEKAKSKDKTLKLYPGLYHNLEHELMVDRITHFNTVVEWVKSRIDSK